MEATLIYNATAGIVDAPSVEEMIEVLWEAGYTPVYRPTRSEDDLDAALKNADGLIVAAGGDGTMRATASRLIARDTPLCIVPMGTANNIGRTLGIDGDPLEILRGLSSPEKVKFDVGRVEAPWGRSYFLEGMGFGFFADILATYDPEKGKSVFRGVATLTKALSEFHAYDCSLRLDGRDITNQYLLVEVLNTKAVGPRLMLAPNADPKDGQFDVICVPKEERPDFLKYVSGLVSQEFSDLPNVSHYQGRVLEIGWTGFPIHVDADVGPHIHSEREGDADIIADLPTEGATVTVEIMAGALEIWLPQTDNEEED